jgi:hypothetical protein
LDEYLHSPLECNNYRLYNPLPFSHSRYFRIKLNQLRFKFKDNSPYISGDSIAGLCDYIAFGRQKDEKIDLQKVAKAKSIFVPGEKFEEFLLLAGKVVTAKTLVTGNSDQNFEHKCQIPPSVTLWLCQNNAMPSSNIIRTLPIGIENIRLGRTGLPKYYKIHDHNANPKRILVPPMSPTNPIRFPVIYEALKNPHLFDVRRELMVEKEYFELTRKYRFVMCCEGNGFENHRIWETLYQGSFPVLLESPWALSLKYLGLPILYVKSIQEVTPQMLADFIELNKHFIPENLETLWIPYWSKIIRAGAV